MPISLSEAARELGIPPNGLRRWVKRANIDLVHDPTDQRRRMLRTEDFERLRRERARAQQPGDRMDREEIRRLFAAVGDEIEALRDIQTRQTAVISRQIAALMAQLSALAERVARLEETLRKAG